MSSVPNLGYDCKHAQSEPIAPDSTPDPKPNPGPLRIHVTGRPDADASFRNLVRIHLALLAVLREGVDADPAQVVALTQTAAWVEWQLRALLYTPEGSRRADQ